MKARKMIDFIKVAVILPFYPRSIKYFKKWFKSLARMRKGFKPIDDQVPWLSFGAIGWLGKNLNKKMVVFEYGSGGSTLFFAKRVKKLVSIEHNMEWYAIVSKKLRDEKISNCAYSLIKPEKSFEAKKSGKNNEPVNDSDYASYIESISKFPDNYFDLVIVDGRRRVACIKHSLSKVKPGGFLMLDNAQRARYSKGKKMMSAWEKITFKGLLPYGLEINETSVWKKPSGLWVNVQ